MDSMYSLKLASKASAAASLPPNPLEPLEEGRMPRTFSLFSGTTPHFLKPETTFASLSD